MRSLLFSVLVLVTVFVASGSWTGGFRRLNKAESEELNEICGKTLTWQYPRRSVQRISHGTPAIQGELPWAARLIIATGTGRVGSCSASIISKYHIITAAHCFIANNSLPSVVTVDLKNSFALVGSGCAYGGLNTYEICEGIGQLPARKVRISKIIFPESSLIHIWPLLILFDGKKMCTPDIAIVELENPISDMNGQMVPICVPSYITFPPVEYTQYGFGDTGKIRKDYRGLLVNAQLYKLRQNKLQLRNYFMDKNLYIEPLCKKMVAVQHSQRILQTCEGDSGGGLSGTSGEKHYLFGVLRGGNHDSCGLSNEVKDVYSLYTNLIPYNDFLCFYTGVCPLGYDVYMDRYYAWHPEAAVLYSEGNFFTWLNKGYFGIYKRIGAPEDHEKENN